jgi:hypothetical protein
MKKIFLLIILFGTCQLSAQKNCDYSINEKDSIGTIKSTKQYLVYQRVFGSTSNSIYLNLTRSDETPFLTVLFINKSPDFIKANCFDAQSKLYFQLENGKIITLLHENTDKCGNYIKSETDQKNVRILEGNFFFMKDTMEELKKSPISLLRIKLGTDTIDYVFKEELVSEIDGKLSRPNGYFMDYLHCIQN